jgi:hypothetical protein
MSGRGENDRADEQDVLLEVNAHVHEVARRFEVLAPGEDSWDFTCECGAEGCRVTVPLTLAEYEALRASARPVLAPGHEKHA